MTPRRAATAFLAVAAVIITAALLAAANYHDDAPEQTWQYDLGIAVVRFGLPVLIAIAIISVISAIRNDR
jgi:hypothetical protein